MGDEFLGNSAIHVVALLAMVGAFLGALLLVCLRARYRVKRVDKHLISQVSGGVALSQGGTTTQTAVGTMEQMSGQGAVQQIPGAELARPTPQPAPAMSRSEQEIGKGTRLYKEPQEWDIAPTEPSAPAVAPPHIQAETVETVLQPQSIGQIQGQPVVAERVKRRDPGKRGGRSRLANGSDRRASLPSMRGSPQKSAISVRPEIVCWKRERQWLLGVEVSDEIARKQSLEVFGDGEPLLKDSEELGCWHLASIGGEILVQWEERGRAEKRTISVDRDCLLFKLGGRDHGRHAKYALSGEYLAVVPDCWTRDDHLSGPPFAAPEPVAIDGYKAHFFSAEDASPARFAFHTPSGHQVIAETRKAQLELIGKVLHDASDRGGPLFGQEPPKARTTGVDGWKGMPTVAVGQEGPGRKRWREVMRPDPSTDTLAMPKEIADLKAGWYFLRSYDESGELVESLDFRFIAALSDIQVDQTPPFPCDGSHKPAIVRFIGNAPLAISPADRYDDVGIEQSGEQIVLRIPPVPARDLTQWDLGARGGGSVRVAILVERVWWVLGDVDEQPTEWQSEVLDLSPDDFRATSRKALWLRFPRPGWGREVRVGFSKGRARPYQIRVAESTAAIPLRDYGDSQELSDNKGKHHLKAWLADREREHEGVLCMVVKRVAAPPTPLFCVTAWGRSKNCVAKASLQEGAGNVYTTDLLVWSYSAEAYERPGDFLHRLLTVEEVASVLSHMDTRIKVKGSGPKSVRREKAAAHALARALAQYSPNLRPILKRQGFGGARVSKRHLLEGGETREPDRAGTRSGGEVSAVPENDFPF